MAHNLWLVPSIIARAFSRLLLWVTLVKVGGKHEANSQCTPQFLEQYYHSRDLNIFWKLYGGGYFHRDDIDKVFIKSSWIRPVTYYD